MDSPDQNRAGGGRARAIRGRDISVSLEINFKEAASGVERKVVLTKMCTCEKCQGEGAEEGVGFQACSACRGSGKIRETRNLFRGTSGTITASSLNECSNCHGRGKIPEKNCPVCKGEGAIVKNEEVKIKIPPGIESGQVVKLSGQGEAMAHGISGDLYARIRIKPRPFFKREDV